MQSTEHVGGNIFDPGEKEEIARATRLMNSEETYQVYLRALADKKEATRQSRSNFIASQKADAWERAK